MSEVAQSPSTTAPASLSGKEPTPARYVPGAPPPAPPKVAKKKRATKPAGIKKVDEDGIPSPLSAALIEVAPSESDVRDGSVAAELVAGESEKEKKPPSPIVELINKRIRPLKKKIVRSVFPSKTFN